MLKHKFKSVEIEATKYVPGSGSEKENGRLNVWADVARALNSIKADPSKRNHIFFGGKMSLTIKGTPDFSSKRTYFYTSESYKENTSQIRKSKPVSKKEILAVLWPLTAKCKKGIESFENALGDVPLWLLPAMVIRGKPGRNQGSHMWNPVTLVSCLYSHGWVCHENKLQAIMEESFFDWLDEWEIKKELIFATKFRHSIPALITARNSLA